MRYSKKFKSTSGDSSPLRVTWEDDWKNVEIFFQGSCVFRTTDLMSQKEPFDSVIPELGNMRVYYDTERNTISITVSGIPFEMDTVHTWNNFHGLSVIFFALGGSHLLYGSFLLMQLTTATIMSPVVTSAAFINSIIFLITAIQLRKGKYFMYFVALGVLVLSIPLAATEIYYFRIWNIVGVLFIIFFRPIVLALLLSQVNRVLKAMKTSVTIQDDELLDI